MSFYYYFNKFFYLIGNDRKIPIIEEVMSCSVIGGIYHPKYISYLIKSSCDENQLQTLEQTVKRNCTLKYNHDTKNWILKVYHKHVVLPKFLPFQYHEDKSHLILGQTLDGICKIKICEIFSNGLIVGASGSGKSCLAQSMIYNALLSGISIWIADLKSSHDYRVFNTKLALSLEQFEIMLNEFIEEVERRLNIDKHHKPLIFFIDELFVVSCLDKKNRDKIMNKLILVMSRCRSANAHIILICQKATSTILDTRIICNISCKIVLKTSNRQESRNVLDGDETVFDKKVLIVSICDHPIESEVKRYVIQLKRNFSDFSRFVYQFIK